MGRRNHYITVFILVQESSSLFTFAFVISSPPLHLPPSAVDELLEIGKDDRGSIFSGDGTYVLIATRLKVGGEMIALWVTQHPLPIPIFVKIFIV